MFRLFLNSNANGNRFLFFTIIFLLKSGFFSKWFFSIICRVSSKNYSFPIEGIVFCQQYSKIRPRSHSSIGWFGLLSDLEDLQIYNWLFITISWGVPLQAVWHDNVLLMLVCFIWFTVKAKILTFDSLKKMGLTISNWCLTSSRGGYRPTFYASWCS